MQLELRLSSSIDQVDAAAWDACAGGHPFVQHAFLKALQASGAVGPQRGVLPQYVVVSNALQGVVACAPAMLKWGTAREYGPEARWLKTAVQAGQFAWPKFQLGVPWFPTPGPRVLVRPDMPVTLKPALLKALRGLGPRLGAATVFNVMHVPADEARIWQEMGALISREWQSVWQNPGYGSLAGYLATLPEHKRSRFRKDRRNAEALGLTYRVLRGSEITARLLADYYEGHHRVCERHGHPPWLPATTYTALAQAMGNDVCLMGYFDASGQWVAGLLALMSRAEGVLYLLQWSDLQARPHLAIDGVCLRPIDYAIEQRVHKVDSGLAAPHKHLRGWQTQAIYNAHWFANDALQALARRECALP